MSNKRQNDKLLKPEKIAKFLDVLIIFSDTFLSKPTLNNTRLLHFLELKFLQLKIKSKLLKVFAAPNNEK